MKLNRSHKKQTQRTYQRNRWDGPRLVEDGSRSKDAQHFSMQLLHCPIKPKYSETKIGLIAVSTHTPVYARVHTYTNKPLKSMHIASHTHLHKPRSNHLLNNPVSTQIKTLTGLEKQRSFLTNNVKRPPVGCDEWIKPSLLWTLSERGMNEYIIMRGTTSLFLPHSLSVFLPINLPAWLPAHIQSTFCPD